MGLLSWLNPISAIAGAIVGPVTDKLFSHLDAKTAAERDIALSSISKAQADNQVRGQLAPAFKGLIYCIALPPAVHFALICLDSSFPASWNIHLQIPRLPAPYDEYEKQILLSFFILQPASQIATGIKAWGLSKWFRT